MKPEYPVIGTLDIRGAVYEVTCDSGGRFNIKGDDALDYGKYTLEELREALMKAKKRAAVRLTLNATLLEHDVATPIVVTGRNQKTRYYIIKHDNGRREELRYATFLAPLTAPERTEYSGLCAAIDTAKAALEAFKKRHAINVDGIINAAEKAAEQGPDKAEELRELRDETDAADGATNS